MNLKDIFINPFGRLRSGWRFTIFILASQILLAIFGLTVVLSFSRTSINLKNDISLFLIITNIFGFFSTIIVGWLCGKFFEGLPFRALGSSFSDNWLKDLFFGGMFGVFAMLLAAAVTAIFGNQSFELNRLAAPSAIWLTLGITLVVFIAGAVAEEAIFRGYALQTFFRAKLSWFGIIFTSVLFASGHIFNPNSNVLSWVNTCLAGIFFGVAYEKTRTLWFPFGMHLMWNWIQGSVLGISVSGLKELTPAPIFQPIGEGTSWITGGEYGIEAGFACTVALIVTTLLIWFAPFLKPTAAMVNLTSHENPKLINPSES